MRAFQTLIVADLVYIGRDLGPCASSLKQLDYSFIPKGQCMPTVLCAVGLTETYRQLIRDLRLWMEGGAGNLSLAILVKFNRRGGGRVAGFVEFYEFDTNSPTNVLNSPGKNDRSRIKKIRYWLTLSSCI